MSKYRDDLEAAQLRIESLENQLAELRERKRRPRRRLRSRKSSVRREAVPRSATRKWIPLAMVGGALALFGAVALLSFDKTGSRAAPPASDPPGSDAPASVRPESSGPTNRDGPPPESDRPRDCSPRGAYASTADLPLGASVVRFDVCLDCDCCLADGAFPPTFADTPKREFIPESEVCRECEGLAALRRAGIVPIELGSGSIGGVVRGHGNRSTHLEFTRPVRMFAATSSPGGLTQAPFKSDPAQVTLTARDERGRAVDVTRATYSLVMEEGEPFQEAVAARRRFLVVEACSEDSVIASIELTSTDLNMSLSDLTLL
jgi:hypothetical protein